MDMSKRQLFQTGMQALIAFISTLLTALTAIGGFPAPEQIYMAFLGASLSAIAVPAALFGVSKASVGGVENEDKIVRALYTDPSTNELVKGTTPADLAASAPADLKK